MPSNAEVQRVLGMQYAESLKENKEVQGIYKDCEEVIHGSLGLLEHYNKVRLMMQQKQAIQGFGAAR